MAVRSRIVVLWLGLATILVAARASPLQRNRRILNEPGDIPNKGNTTLPYGKRQQIIYLLNKEDQSSKRDKEPGKTVTMEKYAKELSSDGRVLLPNASKLLVSEDFHRGRFKEMAVNKGDGPPNVVNSVKPSGQTSGQSDRQGSALHQRPEQQQQQQQQNEVKNSDKKSRTAQVINGSKPTKAINTSTSDLQVNFKKSETYNLESKDHNHLPLTRNSDIKILNEDSPLRKKDSFVRPVGRLYDGELIPPSKPIQPNVFEIREDDIVADSHRPRFREYGSHSRMHMFHPSEDRPIRRWRHRYGYYHHRPVPLYVGHRPRVYFMPMYAGRSNVQMAQFAPSQDIPSAPLVDPGQGPAGEYGTQPVMMQPLVPLVSSAAASEPGVPLVPSQPMLQSPFVQKPDDRSSLYTVPMTTAPQQPPAQQLLYPVLAVPAMQQPQVQLVQQPSLEQGARVDHLASTHWTDEPGHERSEVSEEGQPRARGYDDDDGDSRYDEERYHSYNNDERMSGRVDERMDDRRYQDDRDSVGMEEEREAEQERLYRERGYYENSEPRYDQDTRYVDNVDENASVRSSPSTPAAAAPEESNEDDDDEENESEESERALQDSREDPVPSDDGPPEVEREDSAPPLHYNQANMDQDQPSVIRFPSYSLPHRMDSSFPYSDRLSVDTYSREQLLGPSVPLRERVLPRYMNMAPRISPMDTPNGEISEMSASEARFRERMRMELQAKDQIPKGFHSDLSDDGFKNVVIRLNGEPLENASDLRSKIIDGRIVQGKGKIIKSKGPMRIRVTHKGTGKNRIKFIDIISPQKYSVTESRSKIGRAPNMTRSNHNMKKTSRIHKNITSHASSTSRLKVKDFTRGTANITRKMKTKN